MQTKATALIIALLGLSACSEQPAPPAATPTASNEAAPAPGYTPQPVYCADGSGALCAVIPSFIGPDPALQGDGYQGLSHNVTSAATDPQTPFDNMSWQMFVALNWQASQSGGDPATGLTGAGPVLWQGWARPEDVFGGPTGLCDNPNNLPRFDIIAKSGAQGSRDEEFIQATGQPLIDVNGNWTLFERRLNDIEQQYIESHGLNTYAGQQTFVEAGKSVLFPPGDSSKPNGQIGAMELKAAWRIIDPSQADRYFSTQALIDVQGAYVRDGQPLCAEVTLGLVGLHIIQANATDENLLPQFIWASFEHVDNAPLAAKACDPVDNNCYQTIPNSNCPAAANAGDFSFSRNACSGVTTNNPPVLNGQDTAFIWERQAPYAQSYLTSPSGGACEGDPSQCCGTQVAHCWSVYDLTAQLNTDWQGRLSAINSVFANYYLIGTNWGGSVEPELGKYHNNSVPAFFGNATMETYVQAGIMVKGNPEPVAASCVACHAGATLAYPSTGTQPSANFSFLLGLATEQQCTDLDAGPIFNQAEAEATCPKVCSSAEQSWNGQWVTTQWGVASVCGCCD
jgi:hypothetical protein